MDQSEIAPVGRPEKKARLGQPPMKTQIKQAARDLFIQRGIGDVSYGDIAEVVNTTRANLHYHFGNKDALIEAVFQETFDSVENTFQEIWAKPGLTLDQRIELTAKDSAERFYQFNDHEKGRRPWSLSAQARFTSQHISSSDIAPCAIVRAHGHAVRVRVAVWRRDAARVCCSHRTVHHDRAFVPASS